MYHRIKWLHPRLDGIRRPDVFAARSPRTGDDFQITEGIHTRFGQVHALAVNGDHKSFHRTVGDAKKRAMKMDNKTAKAQRKAVA